MTNKEITDKRKYLINRIGIFRNRANLSARELSLTIDKTPVYISKFENGDFSIPAEVLLDVIDVCGIGYEGFFSENLTDYAKDKECLDEFRKLSAKSKETIINLMREMKG